MIFTSSNSTILKQLKIEEGFRSVPYRDSMNWWTIGYGFNCHGRDLTKEEHDRLFPDKDYPMTIQQMVDYWRKNPISEEDAIYLLEQCIQIAQNDAEQVYGNYWKKVPDQKKVPILDMIFNLGITKYKKFKKHIDAVRKSDWKKASLEVSNSLAAAQDPNRYKRIAKELEND